MARRGSLTAAAKSLGISQPALSQGLSSLEKELGFRIFNRRANPVTLTDEGKLYFDHIIKLSALNDSFEKKLKDYRDNSGSRVTVGAPAVYVKSVIGPAIKKMNRPDYLVSIKTASLENLIKYAGEGKIDCFISTVEDLPSAFETRFVCQEEIVLCVPKKSQIDSLDFSKLKDECFISLDSGFPLQQEVNRLMQKSGFEPKSRIIIDQVSEAVNLVELGLGVCFASKEAALGRNVRIIPTDLVGRKIYIAYDKDIYKTEACEEFIRSIVSK